MLSILTTILKRDQADIVRSTRQDSTDLCLSNLGLHGISFACAVMEIGHSYRLGNLHTPTMSQDLNISAGTLPTIVFIPASFSPASFYNKTIDRLREIGFEAIIHTLPSASREPPEKAATLAEDVTYFHGVVAKLVEQGKEVVLVTHSYGGIVGTEVCKGLTKTDREAAGKKGGLIRLVYMTAVVPMLGQSLNNVLGFPANLSIRVRKVAYLPRRRLTLHRANT